MVPVPLPPKPENWLVKACSISTREWFVILQGLVVDEELTVKYGEFQDDELLTDTMLVDVFEPVTLVLRVRTHI